MKLVLLGHPRVGKTTYMASLYRLMQRPVEGFSLRTPKTADHLKWLSLVPSIDGDRYPPATEQRTSHDLILQYQRRDVLSLTWADYPGRTIPTEPADYATSALLPDLQTAEGILLFCDAAHLRSDQNLNEIHHLTTLLTIARQTLTHPISLAIVLTKTDQVKLFNDDLFRALEPLIQVVNTNASILGAFIPVACGKQFINVPLPLYFAIYTAITLHASSLAQQAEAHRTQAMAWQERGQSRDSRLKWLRELWHLRDLLAQVPTDEAMAYTELSIAYQKYQELALVQAAALALKQQVAMLPLIKPKLSLKDYAQACTRLKFYQSLSDRPNSTPDPW